MKKIFEDMNGEIYSNRKYCLLKNDSKELSDGTVVYRIRACADILPYIQKGDIGGYVESCLNLSDKGSCWIADDAVCYGKAIISGKALVYDDAQVFGNAQVFDHATVSRKASVFGNATVYGNSKVTNNARVHGNATVYGEANICGQANIFGNASVSGKEKVTDTIRKAESEDEDA